MVGVFTSLAQLALALHSACKKPRPISICPLVEAGHLGPKALGANEGTAGILWEASKLEIDAREMMALEKSRAGLAAYLKKDSPALAKLLDALRKKIAPGMTWADIFMTLPAEQKARQREIYRRLMLDERLKALNQGERLQLTNELDRAWQRERRKVFLRELEKITNLGKSKKDKDKVNPLCMAPFKIPAHCCTFLPRDRWSGPQCLTQGAN